jgi:periplasmic protein TonB
MKSVLASIVAVFVLGVAAYAQPATQESKPPYRKGDGVVLPTVVSDIKPSYTADAMQARVQGSVHLECVVKVDGTVSDVKVVKPLSHGLDEASVDALKQWRFKPGTKDGEAVPVIVEVEMTFALGRKGRSR